MSLQLEEIIEYENKYDDIIQKGINQNKNTPSKYLKDKEKAVLNRLQKYRENYFLLFLNKYERTKISRKEIIKKSRFFELEKG